MNKEELLEYIDNNSNAIVNFKDKVRADQQVKNKKRQPAKRWNDARIERNGKLISSLINLLVIFTTSSLEQLKLTTILLRKVD